MTKENYTVEDRRKYLTLQCRYYNGEEEDPFAKELFAHEVDKSFFLDELPEFSKTTLEVLRQPLEDRKITISRAKYTIEYPCSFMFVASANPCPCGYYGDRLHTCVCTPGQISRYMSKISGPLLDRIELR